MSEQKETVESLQDLLEVDATEYKEITTHGKRKLVIGSLTSADMFEWIDEGKDGDDKESKDKRREAGLRLLVKSLVINPKRDTEGNIIGGNRVPETDREKVLAAFRKKDAKANGNAIAEVMRLNGLDRVAKTFEVLKNGSSEARTDASPTSSPSPQGA